jgi:hypothetical protein
MNGPYPEITNIENASFHMVHVYTINWFKKVQNINYCSHAAQRTFNYPKRGGGVSWHSCLFCHIPKFANKKSERGDSGMGQHGFNTGTCFSVSSDDKLVLFLFPRRDIHCIDKRGSK